MIYWFDTLVVDRVLVKDQAECMKLWAYGLYIMHNLWEAYLSWYSSLLIELSNISIYRPCKWSLLYSFNTVDM